VQNLLPVKINFITSESVTRRITYNNIYLHFNLRKVRLYQTFGQKERVKWCTQYTHINFSRFFSVTLSLIFIFIVAYVNRLAGQ